MGVEETYKGVGNVSTVRASRPVVTAWAPEDATSPRGRRTPRGDVLFRGGRVDGPRPVRSRWVVRRVYRRI